MASLYEISQPIPLSSAHLRLEVVAFAPFSYSDEELLFKKFEFHIHIFDFWKVADHFYNNPKSPKTLYIIFYNCLNVQNYFPFFFHLGCMIVGINDRVPLTLSVV